MNPATKISGLYALTPDWLDSAKLLNTVRAALEGGVRVVQYRNKRADANLKKHQAAALFSLTREFDAMLIVNDDIELALSINADGVHVGAEDIPLAQARNLLGASKVIGVSCYNSLSRAQALQAQGADYVAFGSFFNSSVKPDAVTAPLSLLAEAKTKLHVPIVVIGGITLDNAPVLINAGADAVAVISSLFDNTNVHETARAFGNLFKQIPISSNSSACTS